MILKVCCSLVVCIFFLITKQHSFHQGETSYEPNLANANIVIYEIIRPDNFCHMTTFTGTVESYCREQNFALFDCFAALLIFAAPRNGADRALSCPLS